MYSTNLPDNNLSYGNGGTATAFARAAKRRDAFSSERRFENRILSALSVEDFERLKPSLEAVTFSEGEDIYKPEDKINFVYFPETAVVSQFHILEDGRTMEIAMIGKDGATGFGALFGSENADCFSQISVAGGAYRIGVETLKQEFNRGGALQKLLLEYSNRYVAQISRGVVCNNYHSIEKRFCTWLLMLCDRHGANRIGLTHSQIAGYLGVHRPSFTHIASTLRERGIIDYSRGYLKVTDRAGLLESSCDCYARIY